MKYLSISNEERSEWTNITEYLESYATNSSHDLRKEEWKRIGYTQSSVPDRKVCDLDPYSSIYKFPLGSIESGNDFFKQVFDARKIGFGTRKMKINLGGHVMYKPSEMTRFGIIHFHYRCIEIGKCLYGKNILE